MADSNASELPSSGFEAGTISSSNFLGMSESGLASGSVQIKLGLFGALLLLAVFAIPVSPTFGKHVMAWQALDGRSPIPLLFPALAALLGLVAAFAPLQVWQRSISLVLAGVIGLGTLPFLGDLSGSPEMFLPGITLGLLLAGWGLTLRCFDAQSMVARYLAIAGAAIALIGYFLPLSNGDLALPIELRFYLHEAIGSSSALGAYKAGFNRDPMVFFTTVYLMLPLLLLPAAAALSWPKPTGAWDKSGKLVRPLARFIVLYVPIGFALLTFNLFGYNGTYVIIHDTVIPWDDFNSAALLGRIRMLAFGAVFSVWAVMPMLAVVRRFQTTDSDANADLDANADAAQ